MSTAALNSKNEGELKRKRNDDIPTIYEDDIPIIYEDESKEDLFDFYICCVEDGDNKYKSGSFKRVFNFSSEPMNKSVVEQEIGKDTPSYINKINIRMSELEKNNRVCIVPKKQKSYSDSLNKIHREFVKELEILEELSNYGIAPKLYSIIVPPSELYSVIVPTSEDKEFNIGCKFMDVAFAVVQKCNLIGKEYNADIQIKFEELLDKIINSGYVYLDIKAANMGEIDGNFVFLDLGPEFCFKYNYDQTEISDSLKDIMKIGYLQEEINKYFSYPNNYDTDSVELMMDDLVNLYMKNLNYIIDDNLKFDDNSNFKCMKDIYDKGGNLNRVVSISKRLQKCYCIQLKDILLNILIMVGLQMNEKYNNINTTYDIVNFYVGVLLRPKYSKYVEVEPFFEKLMDSNIQPIESSDYQQENAEENGGKIGFMVDVATSMSSGSIDEEKKREAAEILLKLKTSVISPNIEGQAEDR